MGRLHGLIVRKAADFESRVALAKTLWFQAIRNKMKHGHALWWERCGRPGTARAMQVTRFDFPVRTALRTT